MKVKPTPSNCKANVRVSQQSKEKINNAIKECGKENYKTLYGYQMINLIIMKLVTHYAITYDEKRVYLVEINFDGILKSELKTFKLDKECKIDRWGRLVLSSIEETLKLTIPISEPTVIMKGPLSINQEEEVSEFLQHIKEADST